MRGSRFRRKAGKRCATEQARGRKAAAEDGWKRCLAFFDKHLKGA